MKKLLLVWLVTSLFLGGCALGLTCQDGEFYYDGQKFESCDQCPYEECSFDSNGSVTCTYPNGRQQCEMQSGSETATCGNDQATINYSGGQGTCE